MFTKDDLMKLTNADLVSMCKERNISIYKGKGRLNKTEMVEKLLSVPAEENVNPVVEEKPVEAENKTTERKAQPKPVVKASEKNNHVVNPVVSPVMKKELTEAIKENEEKQSILETPWVMGNKDELIAKAEVGTLMAFIDGKGKPRSGKMVNRSSSRRMVKLVTEYDWEFVVSYDSILWVKNGPRWPKAVYTMLKEYKNGKPVCITKAETQNQQTNN